MINDMQALPDAKLGELLVKAKIVDIKKLAELMDFAKESNIILEQAVLEKGLLDDQKLNALIAAELKLPTINLAKLEISPEVFGILPLPVALKYKIVVFEKNATTIKLAMVDPSAKTIIDLLAQKSGIKPEIYLASYKDVKNVLSVYQRDLQRMVDNLLQQDIGQPSKMQVEDPPVAKIIDSLIEAAYEDKASDIHIEPQETTSVVRFRIDGLLQKTVELPKRLHERVITRLKVLSGLRTDEHLSPQDGKLRQKIEEDYIDIRLSIMPIVDGEKAVLRLLSSRSRQYTLEQLGMSERDLQVVFRAFTKSYGMILSTGPTGSGKTTTIYAILKILNAPEKNITTIEDPVEYRIFGANQVQVNARANLTFASGLRSILRQDPNIVFVGEIRDNETANIAVNAALTGHLVLSTLHTNDAATAIPRLADMDVEPFLVGSTVSVVIAQRLVRQICNDCRQEMTVSLQDLSKDFPVAFVKKHFGQEKSAKVFKGKGCKICRKTGYKGRIGLFEVLEVTDKIRKLIAQKANNSDIADAAISEGMQTILDDGLTKIAAGKITVEEVLRVTKAEFL